MGNSRNTGYLQNAIKVADNGNISLMHGSTMLMQISSSGAITTTGVISGSAPVLSAATASFVALAQSASNAVSAQTASFANALTVAGTLTAQTLVVQTITSSVDFVTGSTRFGSIAANTHTFTGSVLVSGSIGIGTPTPNNKLTVYGGEIGSQISFTKDAPSSVYGRLGHDSNGTFLTQNARYDGSNWYRDNTSLSSMALALHNGNSRYEFRIASAGSNPITWTNALTINESSYITTPGRIGIGVTSPIAKLDISGSHTSGYGMINMVSSDSCLISLDSTTSSDVRIRFKQLGVDKWFAGTYTSENWELRTGNSDSRLSVTQNGNVGIGVANPDNGMLSINGNWPSGYATVKAYPTTAFSSGGAAGYGIFDSNGTTRRAYMAANSTQVEVWGQQNTRLVLATNDIERMVIDASGRITTPYQPAFYAYGVSGGTFATNNYWIFPSTTLNRGNHYNTSNGIFTAPVSGMYEFAWSNIGGNSDDVFRYFLYINNSNSQQGVLMQLRIDTSASGTNYGVNGSRTAIVNLSTNDTVRIYYYSDSGGNSYPGENSAGNEYPVFMGKLLG